MKKICRREACMGVMGVMGVALALAAPAQAQVMQVGNVQLLYYPTSTGDLHFSVPQGNWTGFRLTAHANSTVSGGWLYQTDLTMRIVGPGGTPALRYGPNYLVWPDTIPWPTSNPGAPQDSTQAQTIDFAAAFGVVASGGTWTLNFTNGGDDAGRLFYSLLDWSNVVVTLTSQPVVPPNDLCSAAIPLQPGASVSGSTIGAGTEGNSNCSFSSFSPDVWYTITPTYDHIAQLSACGSAFDTVLSLQTACPAAGGNTILACNDDSPSCSNTINSYFEYPVRAGQTYYLRVSGYISDRGSFNLTYTQSGICAADFNHDNVADFFDYLDFVAAFAGGTPAADFNHDSVIDFFDYLDFVQALGTGC